jgi:hypothetical protein
MDLREDEVACSTETGLSFAPDNDELFVIETLQYGAATDPIVGGGGSSNCNCNSNCNGCSEEPLA